MIYMLASCYFTIRKYILKKTICGAVALLLGIASVISNEITAAAAVLDAKWSADYTDMKLIINVNTSAPYIQQITAVMYPADITVPTFNDYSRVCEITTNKSGNKIIFGIYDDLNAPDGKYKIELRGNGYMAEQCKKDLEVYVICPNRIKGAGGLLERANTENSSNGINALIGELKDGLLLTEESDNERKEIRAQVFVNIRSDDFNGAFKNLDNVREAWLISDILAHFNESSASKDSIKAKIEQNAALLDTDINDTEYNKYSDAVYSSIYTFRNNYCNKGIRSCTLLKKSIKEFLALAIINDSDLENGNLKSNIETYYKDLGIPGELYARYLKLDKSNKELVLKQLYHKDFADGTGLQKVFGDAVEYVEKQGNKSDNSDSGKSWSGGGGGSYSIASPKNNETNIDEFRFNDCPETHWAYSYIKKLCNKNILSGYGDGSFLPEKNVSREEFVKMIISAVGLYDKGAECEFADVSKSSWSYRYIASARNAEIINGMNDNIFGAQSFVTREDAAVIASRVLKRFGIDADGIGIVFSDENLIKDYAKECVNSLSAMGIITGYEDGGFYPQGNLTRAQAAKIICEICRYV